MRVPDDWFVGFHEGLAARFWQAAGEAMLERDFAIVEALLPPGSVLDVPCGDGRLSRRLAEAGHEVTGIDIAPGALALAPPGLRLMQGDLRALPDIGPFDAVAELGQQLRLPHAARHRALARRAAARRPAGRNARARVRRGRGVDAPAARDGESEYEFAGITMRSNRTYRPDESRLEVDSVFTSGGTTEHGARGVLRPHDRRGRADAQRRGIRRTSSCAATTARTSSAPRA